MANSPPARGGQYPRGSRDHLEDVVKLAGGKFGHVGQVTKGMIKVGDKVTFTNGYGVKFPGHRVLGFCKPTLGNRCVYLDYDCYWFPAGLDELKLEE